MRITKVLPREYYLDELRLRRENPTNPRLQGEDMFLAMVVGASMIWAGCLLAYDVSSRATYRYEMEKTWAEFNRYYVEMGHTYERRFGHSWHLV